MRYQKTLLNKWSINKSSKLSSLDKLIYRSNLLGSDHYITNFGGGNTSSKFYETDPITKKNELVLYVKGSGGDLGSIKKEGFASLYLSKLENLKKIYKGLKYEDEIVNFYPMCTFKNNPRAASIDTPLHAFVPFKEVDHTHPDSIIALATMKNGEKIVKKLFNNKLGWLPWQRPGFDLGLKMEKLILENPHIEGIVLGHHGLFTWGDSNEECYNNSIRLIKTAQIYLNKNIKKFPFGKPVYKNAKSKINNNEIISILRGLLSEENYKIAHTNQSQIVLEFVNSSNIHKVSKIGTSCPDHFLRTKRLPLILPSLSKIYNSKEKLDEIVKKKLDEYKKNYEIYYNKNKSKKSPSLRDPYPVIILIPEYGMIAFANNKSTARIASEFFCNAINVMKGSEGIDKYTGLNEKEAFKIEYWELEEAKLKRLPPAKDLAGKVAFITGAAGGIGSATAKKFLKQDCCVILSDFDKKSLMLKKIELEKEFNKDLIKIALMDVTKENQVKEAVSNSIKEYGGIDILVANAGFSSAALFEDTNTELWNKNMDVLSKGCFMISREVYKMMLSQKLGGSIIFIGSKNALSASKGASAYSVAKSSLLHLSRSIAFEGSEFKIRSNIVNPDAVIKGSKIWEGEWKSQRAFNNKIKISEVEDFYRKRSLLKVSIFPEDIAEAVLFFASSKSKKSTGNILNVDGGNITAFTR